MKITTKDLPSVKGLYKENVKIGTISWFGAGGCADILFVPNDIEDLRDFLLKIDKSIPIEILGAMSNILVRDTGFRGVIIRLGQAFNYINISNIVPNNENKFYNNEKDRDSEIYLECGAGTLMMSIANFAFKNDIGNLEFLIGIPGQIGGGLYMNAGAFGNDISNIMISTLAIDLYGAITNITNQEMHYTYRKNSLNKKVIFLKALLRGKKRCRQIIEEKMLYIKKKREESQPKNKTCGSTFKNPNNSKMKAWELIEYAGCKGLAVGGVKVSDLHANFLVNYNNCSASDIEILIQKIQDKVFKETGIILETELIII